jgi:lipooligosaccharide transport system ATP-binding protein
LRLAPSDRTGIAGHLGDLAVRVEDLPDRVLVYTPDGDAALATLRAAGIHPVGSLVRRSSLEDVFLRLTGRTLTD